MAYPSSTLRRARVQQGGVVVPALTSAGSGNALVVWKGIIDNPMTQTLIRDTASRYDLPNCTVFRHGQEYQVSMFVMPDDTHFYGYTITPPIDETIEWDGKQFSEPFAQHVRFRIRKLTPRECFRLMDVPEHYIDRLLTTQRVPRKKGSTEMVDKLVVSKSQLYKCAGNSIVVACLHRIFEQLFYPAGKGKLSSDIFTARNPNASTVIPHTADNPLKVVTLCSGYDSQCMGLDRLAEEYDDFHYELTAWSEIDKYAIAAHNLVYPEWADRNVGDMTAVDWEPYRGKCDLLTYSTPCQDISQAGKQAGISEGSDTRSGILWHTEKAIDILRPAYLLQENVKALVSKKFMPDFERWQERVASYGYRNYWLVMDASKQGVPQHRERVFMLSIRNDALPGEYFFPEDVPLTRLLRDVLEDDVDEDYFLADPHVESFLRTTMDPRHQHDLKPKNPTTPSRLTE